MKKVLSFLLCFVMAFSAVFPCFIGSSAAQSVTTVAATSSDYTELELSAEALGAFENSFSITEVRFDDEEIVAYNRDTLGKTFTVYTQAANGFEGVSTPTGGYEAKFTAPYTGTYDFRFDMVTDNKGRGAYVQIDDGEIFHAFASYTFGQVINFYGFSAELTAGRQYTFKVIPNSDLGGASVRNAYLHGFAYALRFNELEQSASPVGAFADSISVTEVKFSDADIVSYNKDTRGKSFTVYTASANKMDAVSNPDGGYFAKFTVPYTGTYDFRLDLICDIYGRGAYVQIDDGEIYQAYTVGTFPNVINFYGFSAQLTAGQEYTLKVFPNTEYGGAAGTNAYLHGFAYALQIGELELSDTPVGAFATSDTIGAVNLYDDEIVAYNEALLGKDIGTWSTAEGGQFNGVNIPTEGYVAEFTVPYTGAYEIRFDFVSDNNGRGAYIQVDSDKIYHAFGSYTYPYTASFYGMELNLAAGKHTFKVMREPSRSTAYVQGFAYAFAIGEMEASATPVGAFENAAESSITTVNFYDADIVSYNKDTLGSTFTLYNTAAGGQFNGVSMPSDKAYCAKFTVSKDGYYAFRFDFVSDNNGRGAYVQIDDGKIFDAYGIHAYPVTASYYGMTVYLTAGEHTFKSYRNWKLDGTQTRGAAYIQSFAYTLSPEVEEEVDLSGYPAFTNIVLQLGENQSKLNFTWFSLDEGEGAITFAKASDMVDGNFPADATVVSAKRTDSVKKHYFGNKVTIEGLEPSTDYYYQLANGETKSEIIPFSTGADGAFSFAVVGDPQVGRGATLDIDYDTWGRTLNQLVTADEFASADFMLSVGDQINQFGNTFAAHEKQFDVYSNHDELLSIPTVVTLGNHDNYDHCMHSYHFNEPNLSGIGATADPVTGVTNSSDYWFIYNNVLFLVLNNNDFLDYTGSDANRAADKAAADAHGAFIESVMEETKNLDIDWKIVVYHRSPYGSSYHGNYTVNANGVYNRTEQYNFVNMREYLIPYFYENGIDLVLSGHDHCYTRTHIIKPAMDMDGNYIDASVITPYEDGSYTYADGTNTPSYVTWTDDTGAVHTDLKVSSTPVSVTDPDGILHVTAATASATQVNVAEHENLYTAVKSTANTRQMMRIDVTENSLTLVNYNLGTGTTDEITVIDEFTINKAAETEDPETPEVELFDIFAANMTLGNELAMNFYFKQADLSGTDYYAVITKSYADGREPVEKTIPYSEFVSFKSGSTMLWKVTFDGIAAKEMADLITVQVFDGNGNAVSTVRNDGIRAYIMRNIDKSTFNPKAKVWAVECLNYGAASQTQFGYNTADLANNELTDAHKALGLTDVRMNNYRELGTNAKASNLTLESNISLTMYFEGISDPSTKYAIVTFTDHNGNAKEGRVEGSAFRRNSGLYGVPVNMLVASDARQLVTVTVYNVADETVYGMCKDSVEGYAARMSTGDDLYNAVMKFSQAAYNMFHEPHESALLAASYDPVPYKEVSAFNPVGDFAGIKAITYDGVTMNGQKTKVFAYLGFPEGASAENPVPAVVLVHGSQSGIPYAAWVKEWNDRGYAAISMSTNNFFPLNNTAGDREYNGETENWNYGLYGEFIEEGYVTAPRNQAMNDTTLSYESQWMYHAISQVIHANTLLRSDPRVDSDKVGVSGISWGATVTSLAVGYDTRFAFAIPVYGSGYLTEAHTVFADVFSKGNTPDMWLAEDRFSYADMPILWLCMNNDAPFSLNSNVLSYQATVCNNADTRLAAIHGWGHSHGAGWSRPESYVFADSICKNGAKTPTVLIENGTATVQNPGSVTINGAKIYYLTSEYGYTNGVAPSWQSLAAEIENDVITTAVPSGARAYYYEVAYTADGQTCYTSSVMIEK